MAKAGGGGGAQKSKVVAGMVVGIALGLAAAGFVAWYMLEKNPASFSNKEARFSARTPVPVAPAPQAASAPVAASGVAEPPHYEFYKVLPDKQQNVPLELQHKAATAKPQAVIPPAPRQVVPPKPADATPYIVQAGSFQNQDEAEKLKAKLAFTGMEASVQKADIPGKGVWYRVRLGPYKGLAEANAAIASLKQNGINATAQHAQ